MSYFITTSDARRAAMWERLFGTERLPVLANHARWQYHGNCLVYAYDLALSRLSSLQRDRLACVVSKRAGRPYAEVRSEIETAISWPVKAMSCEVVETAVDGVERPFFRRRARHARMFARKRAEVSHSEHTAAWRWGWNG